jgi:type I restriction enzyme S subunit
MSEYQFRSLGQICSLIKDGTHGTHPRQRDGIPLISAKDVQDGKVTISSDTSRISREEYDTIHRTYEIKEGDLLISLVGSIGRCALVTRNHGTFSAQRSVGILRSDRSILDPKYLYHATCDNQFQQQLLSRSKSTAQAGVYLGELAQCSISLPPLPEQKKIAEILSGIDNLAKAKEKSLFKCKKFLHAKILGEYSDASRSHRHRVSLAELAQEVKRGPSLATNSEKKGIRYITSGNIADGKICLERDNKFLDGFQSIGTCTIKANDLVLNCVNSSAKIGESAIFDCSEHCITGFNNFAITLFPHLSNPHYIYYWTTSADFKSQVRTTIKDAINQVSFSKKDLHKFAIYLPDLVEQNLVATELDSIKKICDKKNQELIALKNLKSGISSLLLSGRKRVSI